MGKMIGWPDWRGKARLKSQPHVTASIWELVNPLTTTTTVTHSTDAKMKILEAQSAQLTNYEVHKHLIEQRERYAKINRVQEKGRRPGNLETIVKEVNYFVCSPLYDIWLTIIRSYSTTSMRRHRLLDQDLFHTMRTLSRHCSSS